jgi:hypothetical protein
MEGAFNAVAERIKKFLVKNDNSNALGKYVVATEVKAVMDERTKYGSRAVEKLARKLGLKAKLLYRWAAVATIWPDQADFYALVQRRNKYGIPLTWSHLEVLTEVTDPTTSSTGSSALWSGARTPLGGSAAPPACCSTTSPLSGGAIRPWKDDSPATHRLTVSRRAVQCGSVGRPIVEPPPG